MKKMQEVMHDIMEPATHLVVTVTDGAVTFVDADGRSRRFMTNDKKEKHQIQSGTLETKTRWDGVQLRQEIEPGGGRKLVRTFSISPENHQLIVTTTREGGDSDRRPPPMRVVYDMDVR